MITNKVYTSADFKRMDESCGIDPGILMENAAAAVLKRINELGLKGPFAVVCGKGNNGGDGWALSCMMLERGMDVTVLKAQDPQSPLTVRWAERYVFLGGKVTEDYAVLEDCATVIDCIFGFSFRGNLREDFIPLVEKINSCKAEILSVDVPSGLDCDRPEDSSLFVRPGFTCTFTGLKRALAASPFREMCGRIFIEDIGTPEETLMSCEPHIL